MHMKNREKQSEILFLLCLFVFYLLWAVVIPFNEAPDESMRYEIPQYIFRHHALPYGGEEELRNPIWGFSYGFTAIFSYILSGVLMSIAGVFSQTEAALLLAARMVSILFAVGTAWLALRIGEELFGKKYKWLFACLIAFWPEVAFISSYVNNDAFSLFTVLLTYYFLLNGKKENWNFRASFQLGIALGFVLLAYCNAYIVIVCAVVFCVVDVIKNPQIEHKVKFIFQRILVVLAGCVLISGWYYVRNFVIYDGDLLGMTTQRQYGELYALEEYKPSNRTTLAASGCSIREMLFADAWIAQSARSFIAGFGYMNLFLDDRIYDVIYLLIGTLLIGCIRSALSKAGRRQNGLHHRQQSRRQNGSETEPSQGTIAFTFMINLIGSVGISMYYSYFNDFQPQGRYCMPMICALAYFMTYGLRGWLRLLENKKLEAVYLATAVVLVIGFSVWVFGDTICAAYLN